MENSKSKIKSSVYDNLPESISYTLVFCLSILLPTILSIVFSTPSALLVSMFINSIVFGREYLILWRHKITSKSFWKIRLFGSICPFIVLIYTVGVATILLYERINNIDESPIMVPNIIVSCLFLFYGIISVIESINLLSDDYNTNTVADEDIKVTDKLTSKV